MSEAQDNRNQMNSIEADNAGIGGNKSNVKLDRRWSNAVSNLSYLSKFDSDT